jgi:hypothetical protein
METSSLGYRDYALIIDESLRPDGGAVGDAFFLEPAPTGDRRSVGTGWKRRYLAMHPASMRSMLRKLITRAHLGLDRAGCGYIAGVPAEPLGS